MIRCRFKTTHEDYRPAVWPIKHPYWCTGLAGKGGDGYWIIVAYADNEEEILTNWPEAYDLDSEEVVEYIYTDRFEKPTWME